MSHFSVVVCIGDEDGKLAAAAQVAEHGFPDGKDIPAFGGNDGLLRRVISDRLETVLAPYDENREVEAYRDYEEGGPEGHWLYRSLKRADENARNGTGVLPYRPDAIGWGSDYSRQTPDEQRVQIAKEAALFRALPEPATWEAIADVHKILYSEDGDFPLVDEEDRAYTMSTSNPDSKWDYWRIGGRWGGKVAYRPECAFEVVHTERGWDSPEEIPLARCDGGPKRALDLAVMREDAAEEARKTYREYRSVVDGLPEAQPWSAFRARLEDGSGYTIDQARAEYHAQPCIRALEGTDFRHQPVRREGSRRGGSRIRRGHAGRQVDGPRPDGMVRRH